MVGLSQSAGHHSAMEVTSYTYINVTHLTLPVCHCPQNYMCKCILLSCKLPPICGTLTSPSSFAEEKNVRLWCPLKAHMAPAWPSCYNKCSIIAFSCLACWDNCHKSVVDINMLILNCWGESFKTMVPLKVTTIPACPSCGRNIVYKISHKQDTIISTTSNHVFHM